MRKLSLAIADSLLDEPFYQAITVDFADHPDLRRERLAEYFACSIEEGRQVGRVDENGDDGAAVWITCEDRELLAKAKEQKLSQMSLALGPQGMANYKKLVDGMNARLPDAGTDWYLSILGVRPSLQSQGRGAQLMVPGLAAVDAAGKRCYLETYRERAVRFYERLHFKITHSFQDDVSGETYWVMSRNPRPT